MTHPSTLSKSFNPLNSAKPTALEESPLSDVSVLIVDDESTMRMLLRAAMRKEGFQVAEARNGIECLDAFQQRPPDIVLMDAMMPGMDGFDCCAALKKMLSDRTPPILMITSLDDPASVAQAFEAGATDYITKPIHWELLRHRIRRLQDILKRQRAEAQIKASLKEKEVMLKEIHHRVKNNLQIICSLLNLQSSAIEDEEILDLFKESQSRVRLMALVHEKLYQSDSLERINLRDYIQSLATYWLRSYEINPNAVAISTDIENIFLGIDTAVSCGLIVNEMVSNSLKYAFSNSMKGTIEIKARLTDKEHFFIEYRDNGVGLPPDIDIVNATTLGLQLISSLTEQLSGELEVISEQGTAFKLKNLLLLQ